MHYVCMLCLHMSVCLYVLCLHCLQVSMSTARLLESQNGPMGMENGEDVLHVVSGI